jgi:hypothetical protein
MSAVGADRTRSARSNDALAIEIKPVLLPVSRPSFLDGARLGRRSDPKSTKRQDHGAHADVRVCALAYMPTARTFKNWGMDVPYRSDSLKLRVQLIAQFDECVVRHAAMPLHAQPLNHFRKPNSLRITRGHFGTIVLRETRLSKGCVMRHYRRLESNG